MNTVFMDESGFTGSNLCDLSQPVFSLASHCFTPEESDEIKTRFFKNFQGPELKFMKLVKSSAGKNMILNFLEFVRENQDKIRFGYAHKPFTLLCKGYDWIVEPHLRRNGIDFYENGGNLAICNLTHLFLVKLADRAYHSELLNKLQCYLMGPSRRTYKELLKIIREKTGLPFKRKKGPLADILQHIYFALLQIHPYDVPDSNINYLEFAFSLSISIMHSWKEKFKEQFNLVHDATSAMSRQQKSWDAIMSKSAPTDLIGYDRRTIEFPIGIYQTSFEKSEIHSGLQIADVLAGTFTTALKSKAFTIEEDDPFVISIWDKINGWNITGHIWPENKFTPEELSTVGQKYSNPIDYYANIIGQI